MSEFLAEAQVLIRPNTAGFRQTLISELTAATRGLKVQIPVLATAAKGAQQAAATTTNLAAANKELAASHVNAAKAAQIDVIAHKEVANVFTAVAASAKLEAQAIREAAAAQSQFARGAGATGLSLLKVRGATLAAGNEFLIGAAAVTVLAKSVKGAIEDEETLFGVTKVLGEELGGKLAADSKTLATSFGITDDAALKFEGALAATLQNAGFAGQEIVTLSEKLVRLAADLAAVRHVPVEDTLKAIQLAVSGNARSLRQYGIVIQNSEVQLRALAQTGKKSVDELNRQELATARLSLVFDRASFAAGGFAANSGSLANQMKILQANIDRLGDSIGAKLVGPIGGLVGIVNLAAQAIDKLKDVIAETAPPTKDAAGNTTLWGEAWNFFRPAAGASLGLIGEIDAQIESLLTHEKEAVAQTSSLAQILGNSGANARILADDFRGLIDPINAANLAIVQFKTNLGLAADAMATVSTAGHQLLDLQFQGASSAAQIAKLQEIVDANQQIIRTPGKGGAAAREAARQARNAAQAQIESIRAKDAAAAEAAASAAASAAAKAKSAAEKAAREAQARLDAQDHQLLLEQQLAQGRRDIKAAKADQTKSLEDDIIEDRKQIRLLDQQIIDAQKIHDKETRLTTLQGLRAARAQARSQLRDDQAEQRRNIRDRRVTAAENAVASARLDFELAQTQGKPSAQIAALQAENQALEAEKALWKGNTNKLKEIRNQIAQNNAEIKRIRGTVGERTNELARLQFQFLETQAGFAANLLGNLIPRSAAAGTVGGAGVPAMSTSTGPGPAGFATAAHRRPFNDLSAASQTSATAGGASRGQMATLIQINQGMLGALLRIAGRQTRQHPETIYPEQVTAYNMNVATGT